MLSMAHTTEQVGLSWQGRQVSIEYQWLSPAQDAHDGPLLVFLHEGLGSVAMWKDFPQALCDACGLPGLVYSRPGYGNSTAREPHERWGPDFMHRQAQEVLPALLDALQVKQRVVLFGHSDGASIALLFAASHPERVHATVVAAPHVFVEDISLQSITQAKAAYQQGDLRQRLAPYHRDVDSAFWGWNDVWLSKAFKTWDITSELGRIRSPMLAMQGKNDEYGTMEQIHRIARHVPQTRLLEIEDCRHSPHRDQREVVIRHVASFFNNNLET